MSFIDDILELKFFGIPVIFIALFLALIVLFIILKVSSELQSYLQ